MRSKMFLLFLIFSIFVSAQSVTLDTPTAGSKADLANLPTLEWSYADMAGAIQSLTITFSNNPGFNDSGADIAQSFDTADATIVTFNDWASVNANLKVNNQIIYWRIEASDGTNNVNANSNFTPINLPTLDTPVGFVNSLPSFGWTNNGYVPTATLRVAVDTDSDYSNGVILEINLDATLAAVSHTLSAPGLADGNYNWYLIVDGVQTESVAIQVIPPPTATTLVAPINDSKSNELYTEFTWTSPVGDPGVITEKLQVSTNAAFTDIIFDVDVTAVNSYTLTSPLNHNTYYFWRVARTNQGGTTNGSELYFKTITDIKPVPYYPGNGQLVYETDPTVKWTILVDKTNFTFILEYHDQADFTAGVPVVVNPVNDIEYQITNLSPGDEIFWRVKSVNAEGNESDWSAVYSFNVDSKLGATVPVPTWPLGNVLTYTKNPTLYWMSTSTATNLEYQIELVEDANTYLINTDKDGNAITNIFVQLTNVNFPTGLKSNTEYTWRVESKLDTDPAFAGNWSTQGSFKTIENLPGNEITPTIIYPKDEVVVYDSKVLLSYMTGQMATGYDFYIEVKEAVNNTDTDFSNKPGLLINTKVNDALSHEISGLSGEKLYVWRVAAVPDNDAKPVDGSATWSDAAYFKTAEFLANTIQVPTNYYPADKQKVATTTPMLSWTYLGDFTGVDFELQYKIEDSGDDTFGNEGWSEADYAGNYGGIQAGPFDPVLIVETRTSHIINTPLTSSNYYWRVRARKGAGATADYTAWSTPTLFTIDSPLQVTPIVPTPNMPTGNFITNSKSVDFNWLVNGLSTGLDYEIEWRIKGFAWGGVKSGKVIVNDQQFTNITFTETGNYEWRIQSFIDDNAPAGLQAESTSGFSTVAEFIISAQAGPVQPFVGSPVNNVTVATVQPELSWYIPSDKAGLKYKVEIATNEAMTEEVVVKENIDASKIKLEELQQDKQYFWRVSSEENGVFSQYSSVGSFTVAANLTSVEDNSDLPTEFELNQNYPNPFNPTTKITYAVPEANVVNIKVYNVLGEIVKSLVDETKEAGRYEVNFDATNLSSGIYFYKATFGDVVITKKMMLLK